MKLELQVTLRGNLTCVVRCFARAWENAGSRANMVTGLGLFWGHFLLLHARPPSFALLEMLKISIVFVDTQHAPGVDPETGRL